MNYFFDTSALVKHFYDEKGSDIVSSIILKETNNIWISELAVIEIFSALYKKYRMKEIDESNLEIAIEGIKLEMEYFYVEPLNSLIVKKAIDLLEKYGRYYSLRTLDSLQISTFILLAEEKDWFFVASDEVLCKIVEEIGYPVLNPEKITL